MHNDQTKVLSMGLINLLENLGFDTEYNFKFALFCKFSFASNYFKNVKWDSLLQFMVI